MLVGTLVTACEGSCLVIKGCRHWNETHSRRMDTHWSPQMSPLEVHAWSIRDEGDSTMGWLAAGTLHQTCQHATERMPPLEGNARVAGWECMGSRHWKYTLCRQGMWETLPWMPGRWYSLCLHLATHLLIRQQGNAAAGKERTLLPIGTLRLLPWKYTLGRHGMIGDSTMG